jgi:hypothetical protein
MSATGLKLTQADNLGHPFFTVPATVKVDGKQEGSQRRASGIGRQSAWQGSRELFGFSVAK